MWFNDRHPVVKSIKANSENLEDDELSDRELLEKVLGKIEVIEDRHQKEVEAIKAEMTKRTDFLQELLLRLVEGKNSAAVAAASKPSAVELYQQKKIEEAKATSSNRPKLP